MSKDTIRTASKIMAKAWTDLDFRRRLEYDSETVCQMEGLILHSNMTFVSDVAGNLKFIVPSVPSGSEMMTVDQLQKLAYDLINGS